MVEIDIFNKHESTALCNSREIYESYVRSIPDYILSPGRKSGNKPTEHVGEMLS